MVKVVINKCYGGFQPSSLALKELGINSLADFYCSQFCYRTPEARSNPKLVEVVERLGDAAANPRFSKLVVVDVPDGVQWYIGNYDGNEWIAEYHRTWE